MAAACDKRVISNVEYESALNNDVNQKYISTVTSRYTKFLDAEERRACGLDALWKTLQGHRDGMGNKFETSLYRHLVWECRRAARKKMTVSSRIASSRLTESVVQDRPSAWDEDYRDEMEHALSRLRLLPEEEQTMLRRHYIEGKNYDEIGQELGYSKVVVHRRIGEAVVRLRAACKRRRLSV